MKESTKVIADIIKTHVIQDELIMAIQNTPDLQYGETTIVEAQQKFELMKDAMIQAAQNGDLDRLSPAKRGELGAMLTIVHQTTFNATLLIQNIDNLFDVFTASGLMALFYQNFDHRNQIDGLTRLTTELKKLEKGLKSSNSSLDHVEDVRKLADVRLQSVIDLQNDVKTKNTSISNTSKDIQMLHEQATLLLKKIESAETDIEAKKLSVSTFSTNIDEYRTHIDDLSEKAGNIVGLGPLIDRMIFDAENALKLKSAEGISAAFSKQYKDTQEQSASAWLVGAGFFIILALSLTVWIVSGWKIAHPDAIPSLIGRIVAVAITISAAAFCAKQYTNIKNLAEDYAYKAVLSKSIVAFTAEIKKHGNDQQVADYITKVMDEIHRDPLRHRYSQDKDQINPKDIVNKLIDKLDIKSIGKSATTSVPKIKTSKKPTP